MNTGGYTLLEVFARAQHQGGRIQIVSQHGTVRQIPAGSTYYKWLKIPMEPNIEYEISCLDCQVSICYLSGCENILETGVCYLEQERDSGKLVKACQGAQYDSPIREAYHFGPWKNWINDPNGLCWFQGYYHMFYQFHPHGQKWSNMYWGHAVSKDLIYWTHLPVVLEPQKEILEQPQKLVGGAFSGSAVVRGEEVVFYLTRSVGVCTEEEETQQQWMMRSRDMLHFSEETLIIDEHPEETTFDFRDPKVLKVNGTWYMVLGSAVQGKGAILLYESRDMEHWNYKGPLLVEEEPGIRCFECPDFMELDGKYVAIGAWMKHYDSWGRYQMSRYYVGDFKDGRFIAENSGWFDFGSNCYAMQSFQHQGRMISIGWISDFYGEHIEMENGACGSMTIPREMHVKDNRLYLTPVKEIEMLRDKPLYHGRGESVCLEHIRPNTYGAVLQFNGNPAFSLQLAGCEDKALLLRNDEKGLRLETRGTKTEQIVFQADVEGVDTLEIYVDRRVTEVYVNHGEAVGTKLFYHTSDTGCFKLVTNRPECIEEAKVFSMKSIWEK